jgi:hypothetical protein
MGEVRTPAADVPPDARAALLDLQVERVGLALDQLRQTQDRLQQAEERLGTLTEACGGILDRWAQNEERHASALLELHGRLAEWNEIERRLLSQSTARIHQVEQRLQQEWHALRRQDGQPAQYLHEQLARMTDACVAGVAAAVRSCDHAEGRLASAQQQFTSEMLALTREFREVLADLRHGPAHPTSVAPWPLDDVMRLHGVLRAEVTMPAGDERRAMVTFPVLPPEAYEVHLPDEPRAEADDRATTLTLAGKATVTSAQAAPSAGGTGSGAAAAEPALAWPPPDLPGEPPATRPGAEVSAPAVTGVGNRRRGSPWVTVAAALAVAAIAAFGYLSVQALNEARAAGARAVTAERELTAVRELAREQLSAMEQSADQRLATVQRAAQSAQALAAILVASDLRRFDLAPAASAVAGSSAVVLLSRRQGVAFSATGLANPPNGWEYQVWLLAPGRALSAGTVRPDGGGRVSTAFDVSADLPRPILGALLTLEPSGGSTQPSGTVVFRQPLPAPAPPGAAVPQS